jgi:alpha-galactosidase/6-phospho-beta-glucosidase family protein
MYCSQQCLNVVGIRHMTWYDDVLDKDRYVMYIPYDPTIEEKMYEKACDYFGVEYEQESCLIDAFFRQHPECTTACISCSCPKCSPRC